MSSEPDGGSSIFLNTNEWDWHIDDPDVMKLIEQGIKLSPKKKVKSSDVRSVYQIKDLFFKVEHPESPLRQLKSRLFPKASSEYEKAKQLADANVPVVECVGWGSCGSKNVLVSKEFSGANTVHDYFYRNFVYGNGQYENFLSMLTAFLSNFFRSGFYHDDLHFGNLLYSPEMGEMVLVDLIDIEAEEELNAVQLRRMQRSILQLREGLGEEDMLLAITACGIALDTQGAKDFFLSEVTESTMRRLNEWPKRKRQILDGYAKFVTPVIEGDNLVLLAKNQLRKEILREKKWHNPESMSRYELHRCESEKAAETLFLRSQFLQLCKVPHRKVAAWEHPNKIYFEPLPDEVEFELSNSSGLEFFTATLAAQEIIAPKEAIAEARYGIFMLADIINVETMID